MIWPKLRRALLLVAGAVTAIAAASIATRSGVEAWTTQYTGVSHGESNPTGAAADIGQSIVIAPDGSVFLAGFLQSSSITLGSLNISASGKEGFVAKFDADGDPIWLRTYAASTGDDVSIYDLEMTPAGDLLIGGRFGGTMTFATAPTPLILTSSGGADGFIARLDSSGVPISAVTVGGVGADAVHDLAYGPGDTVTAVGIVAGDAITPTAVAAPWATSPANDDGVILNLSPQLDIVNWTARVGGSGDDTLQDVDVGSDGVIAAVGGVDTRQPLAIVVAPSAASHTIVTPNPGSSSDIVVASLATSNDVVSVNWSQIIAGTGVEVADGVVIDDLGRVAVAGYGTGPFEVGGVSHSSGRNVDTDLIVSQFGADGTARWSTVIDSGNSRDEARAIAIAPDGQIITVGRYGEPSGTRFLAMAHSPDGTLLWGPVLLGDAANQIAQAAVVSPAGDVYLTGRFAGGPIDPTDATKTITVNGGSDIVLVKFAAQFPPSTTEVTTTTEATTTSDDATTATHVVGTTLDPTPTSAVGSTTMTPTTVSASSDTAILPSTGAGSGASITVILIVSVGCLLALSARRRF